jgi:putative hydrolase of the HAD superfamily
MPSALLLDLYHTLLSGGDADRHAMAMGMGADLGVDPDAFAAEVVAAWPQRMTGFYGDLSAETAALAARLGATPTPSALAAAVQRRFAFGRAQLVPAAASVATIRSLRAGGWQVAIVSNCTFDSALAVRATPLADVCDALVLSCEVHVGKPDPAIYLAACDALGGVDPTDCVYVGDGADGELTGAATLGMRVIQTTEYADSDPTWTGERITAIADLLTSLD